MDLAGPTILTSGTTLAIYHTPSLRRTYRVCTWKQHQGERPWRSINLQGLRRNPVLNWNSSVKSTVVTAAKKTVGSRHISLVSAARPCKAIISPAKGTLHLYPGRPMGRVQNDCVIVLCYDFHDTKSQSMVCACSLESNGNNRIKTDF